jgi:hypothetical protein
LSRVLEAACEGIKVCGRRGGRKAWKQGGIKVRKHGRGRGGRGDLKRREGGRRCEYLQYLKIWQKISETNARMITTRSLPCEHDNTMILE